MKARMKHRSKLQRTRANHGTKPGRGKRRKPLKTGVKK